MFRRLFPSPYLMFDGHAGLAADPQAVRPRLSVFNLFVLAVDPSTPTFSLKLEPVELALTGPERVGVPDPEPSSGLSELFCLPREQEPLLWEEPLTAAVPPPPTPILSPAPTEQGLCKSESQVKHQTSSNPVFHRGALVCMRNDD